MGAAASKAEEFLPTPLIPWGYDDDSEIWDLYRVTGTPTAVYLSAAGEVLAVAPGALPSDLGALFEQLIAQGS